MTPPEPRASACAADDAVERGSDPRRELAGPAVVGLLAALLVVTRLGWSGRPPATVWAEDGLVFLGDAVSQGPEALISVYAGYVHLLPRLLTEGLLILPLSWFGYAVTLTASLVCGAVSAFAYVTARRATGSTAAAIVAALAPALVPSLRVEALGNLANLQWLLLYAAMWALVVDVTSVRTRAVLLLVTAATTPLVALLLPGALLARGRGAIADRALIGLAAGLLLQVVAMFAGPRSAPNPAWRDPGVPPNLVRRAFSEVLGPAGFGALGIAIGLGVLSILALLAISAPARLRRPAAAAALSGVLVLAVTTSMTGVLATRYAAFAALALLGGTAALLMAEKFAFGREALAALLAVSSLAAFPAAEMRLGGPSWRAELDDARRLCASGVPDVPVGLAPDGWGEVELPCAVVLDR